MKFRSKIELNEVEKKLSINNALSKASEIKSETVTISILAYRQSAVHLIVC